MEQDIGMLSTGLLIVVISIVAVIIVSVPVVYLKYLVKVNKNEALIRCGASKNIMIDKNSGRKVLNNCITVVGGSLIVFPWQSKLILKLSTINIPLDIKEIVTKDGIRVHIKANANVNISSRSDLLELAGTLLGGKSQEEIQVEVSEVLQGSLRQIISGMSPEEILEDREQFTQQAQDIAGHDLLKLGMDLNYLRMQDVDDYNGYFKSLEAAKLEKRKETEAKQRTEAQLRQEEYKRELRNAERETRINEEHAQSEEAVATQNKEREIEIAKVLKRMTVAKEEESRGIELAKLSKERNRSQSEANNAFRQVEADIARQVSEIKIKEAENESRRIEQLSIGEAARILKIANARAEEEKVRLLARSEGQQQLADAYTHYNTAALLAVLMNDAPELIEKLLGKEGIASIFREIAKPLGNIDSLNIVDIGKGGDGQDTALSRYAETAPNLVFNLISQLKALGFGEALANLKLNPSILDQARPQDNKKDAVLGSGSGTDIGDDAT